MSIVSDLSKLQQIASQAFEGLEAGNELWNRIQKKAEIQKKPIYQRKSVWLPAAAFAMLLVLAFCFGGNNQTIQWDIGSTGTAGNTTVDAYRSLQNISVQINQVQDEQESLIVFNGAAYMLTEEQVPEKLLGKAFGRVEEYTSSLSLSTGKSVSNIVSAGSQLFKVKGANGLIAANVKGEYYAFQRTAQYGKVGSINLEAALCSPEQVQSVTVGSKTLNGTQAEESIRILYRNAERLNDSYVGNVSVKILLKNGLNLFLFAGEECLTGCGVWYCPEFFQCFQ